ncbi:MAG: glycosyltransferase family 1 protein [Clostridiales bacterium]|nr:glycosyltransferase family 1 protein [Clostridiales bacterium]
MRVLLFYSGIESFNYFTDEINNELVNRGFETYIWDLKNFSQEGEHSAEGMIQFCEKGLDLVICIDRLGINEKMHIDFWNMLDSHVVNILMDPPFRFHPTMEHPPKKYIQFCPDMDHVEYTKRYFPNIENVRFLPHAGTLPNRPLIPYEDRKYRLLFCGTYYKPEGYINEIRKLVGNTMLFDIYMEAAEYLFADSKITVEQALNETLSNRNMQLSVDFFKSLMRFAEPLDWMVRMHYREAVINALLEAGIEVSVLGRGWSNFPVKDAQKLNILGDRIPFKATFDYMENAKICLNVMPGFKRGTHDRVFNSLLLKSVCLTDTSTWLEENFTNWKNIVFYSLDELDKLPDQVHKILDDDNLAKSIAENGCMEVSEKYVWKNFVDAVLEAI